MAPYNIDEDITAGDSGHIAWSESVAAAVNDLDVNRVSSRFSTTATWRSPDGASNGIGGVESGRLFAFPVFLPETVTLSELGFTYEAGAVGDTVEVGIYSDINGAPGDLLANTGPLPTESSGVTVVTGTVGPVQLPSNVYWIAFLGLTTTTKVAKSASSTEWRVSPLGTGGSPAYSTNLSPSSVFRNSQTSMPDPFGTPTYAAHNQGGTIDRRVTFFKLARVT